MSLMFGLDTASNVQRPVKVNASGELEMTAELDSSGLATSANQTNGDQKAKCMGGETDGTQQQLLVSNLGVLQTLDSEVFGKTSQIANQTTLSNTNEATIIANQTNDTQSARCMGNFGGAQVQIKVDTNGVVETSGGGGGGSTQYAVATTGMGSGTGTLMIGSAGGSAKEVNLSTAGSIHTKATELQNEGTTGNANPASGTSMAPGTFSLVVDISNMREGSILYNDASTASFDGLDIEVSADGSTFYRLDGLFPFTSGGVRVAYRSVSLHGLTALRLKNISSSDTYTSVSGTVVGCP